MTSRNYALKAAKRDRAGKGVARALRRENKVPAVIYGDKKEALSISISSQEINLEYNKGHMFTSICDMDLDGQEYKLLARDVQLHPVTDNVIHVDFLRVTAKTKIAVEIPVRFINAEESPGLKEKGVLNVVRFEVELLCSAMDIPDHLDVDLAGKDKGDSVRISDAKMPEGVTPVITNRNFTIATITEPKAMEEEAPVVAEGAEGAAAPAEGAEGAAAAPAVAEGADKAKEGKKAKE